MKNRGSVINFEIMIPHYSMQLKFFLRFNKLNSNIFSEPVPNRKFCWHFFLWNEITLFWTQENSHANSVDLTCGRSLYSFREYCWCFLSGKFLERIHKWGVSWGRACIYVRDKSTKNKKIHWVFSVYFI